MHVRELTWSEPAAAVRRHAHLPHLTFLDSAARDASLGRYSYLACGPLSTYEVADGRANCDGRVLDGDPWSALRALLGAYAQPHRLISRLFRPTQPDSSPTS
jgi:para-aminobenzoate synthetase component 1